MVLLPQPHFVLVQPKKVLYFPKVPVLLMISETLEGLFKISQLSILWAPSPFLEGVWLSIWVGIFILFLRQSGISRLKLSGTDIQPRGLVGRDLMSDGLVCSLQTRRGWARGWLVRSPLVEGGLIHHCVTLVLTRMCRTLLESPWLGPYKVVQVRHSALKVMVSPHLGGVVDVRLPTPQKMAFSRQPRIRR